MFDSSSNHSFLLPFFGTVDMAQFTTRNTWLALFAAVTNAGRHQVDSFDVSSHHSTPPASTQTHAYHINTFAKPILNNARYNHVDDTKVMSFQSTITTSDSKHADATVTDGSSAGKATARAAVNPPEWILSAVDTIVTALLSLASIIVAVVLGNKQLRATRVQLQIILDTVHRRPRANHVEMNDLESGQHDFDGDRIEVRSETTSVDPQRADPIHSAGFLPEPQPHVVGDDQLAQPVRDHGQPTIQPRGLADGDDSLHDEVEQLEDEGQTPRAMPTAIICSQFGRGGQDSGSLNFDDRKALHLDDRESHPLMTASISIR